MIRFLAVLIISFLLLSPLIKISKKNVEKPIIVFALDNSTSMNYADIDSGIFDEMNSLIAGLTDYDVYLYSFGEEVSIINDNILDTSKLNFDEKYTNITDILEEINNSFYNRNVGAVILASDGIVNRGIDPLYMQEEFPFPLYTLAFGDTIVKKDVKIKSINHNAIAYKGNDFPVEVVFQSDHCEGEILKLSIIKDGKIISKENISINSNRQSGDMRLMLSAEDEGITKYTFIFDDIDGEENLLNNRKTIFIDILDEQMNIAIVANSPHPDISAIKDAINSNYSYTVEDFLINDFDQVLDKYNLLIFHQIPSNNSVSVQLANKLRNSEIPVLFIVGAQTNLSIFNNLNLGLNIDPTPTAGVNEAQPIYNEFFSYFTISEKAKELLGRFSPLYTPFANYNISIEGEVLFFQKIVGVETSNPLIFCGNDVDRRLAFICGDGIWRWKLMNYLISQDHDAFNEIINKVVKFLALQMDKRQFRVIHEHQIAENEKVIFRAELYNDIYESVAGKEIDLTLSNEEGQEFSYQYSSLENGYFLDMGILSPGKYTFSAKTTLGDKIFEDRSEFSVLPVIIERVNTVADHRLLYKLASNKQGKMYYPDNINLLFDDITKSEQIKPVIYAQKRYTDLIDIPWVLISIIILLAAEWLMRKWGGSY